MISIEMRFNGSKADEGLLEFYDASRALAGFQRSLALTTHLIINGEIITQAPALSGAEIYIPAPERGSWKTKACIVIGGAFAIGSVGKDSPVGHVVTSIYDYVLSRTMGFHVDYDKTLQQLYDENSTITETKLDSLIEKVENSVADMHRPIVKSETATFAQIYDSSTDKKIGPDLNKLTYDYVRQTIRSDETDEFSGYISGYNLNNFKGRIFCLNERRTVPFELMPEIRNRKTIGIITRSQHRNGQIPGDPRALVTVKAHRLESMTGHLKRLHITEVKGD